MIMIFDANHIGSDQNKMILHLPISSSKFYQFYYPSSTNFIIQVFYPSLFRVLDEILLFASRHSIYLKSGFFPSWLMRLNQTLRNNSLLFLWYAFCLMFDTSNFRAYVNVLIIISGKKLIDHSLAPSFSVHNPRRLNS